jgi:hypothetical protein
VPVLVAAPPSGARIRTRLRLSADDEQVLRAVGRHLGRLAGQDLTRRCRLGRGPDQRADRKRALTAASSSRWAGAITRTSGDQWARAYANLLDARTGLRRAVTRLRARLAVPVGQSRGGGRSRVRGYHSQAERFQKQRRLQHLGSRLDESRRGWPQVASRSAVVDACSPSCATRLPTPPTAGAARIRARPR